MMNRPLPQALLQLRPLHLFFLKLFWKADEEVVPWITTNCSVTVNLIELSWHSGLSRESALATLQVRNLSIVSVSQLMFLHQIRRKHDRY
jgi:hypothetical protein